MFLNVYCPSVILRLIYNVYFYFIIVSGLPIVTSGLLLFQKAYIVNCVRAGPGLLMNVIIVNKCTSEESYESGRTKNARKRDTKLHNWNETKAVVSCAIIACNYFRI